MWKRPLRTVLMWGALLSGCAGQETVIDPVTRIHHDDFEYSVPHVDRTDRIGDEQNLKVRGEFLMGDLFDGNQYKKKRVRLF